jgi:hypothetical protein
LTVNAELVGAAICSACFCGALRWPLAIMLSARSGPGHKHAVAMLQWLKWGVLISGSTGWVHYSSLALSNLMGASGCPRVSQVACDRGSW